MSADVLTEVVEGWTGALPFRLDADGTAVDLTGLTVGIILKDNAGNTIVDSTAGVSVTSSTGGTVSYTPASSSAFVAGRSPYRIRFTVYTSSAAVFFPNDEADLIEVFPR